MYTQATGSVSTGVGAAKQNIEFEFDELNITQDASAQDLVTKFATTYSWARIVKILNTKSERDAGNLARTKFRIKPENKVNHATAWAMEEMPDEYFAKMKGFQAIPVEQRVEAIHNYLLNEIWPRAAGDFELYGG